MDGRWFCLVRALADVVGAGWHRQSGWNAGVQAGLHTHGYNDILSMLTEYVYISRVPACAHELSDRRRETRNGDSLVGLHPTSPHLNGYPRPALLPIATALSLGPPTIRRALVYCIFRPSIAERPTLPSLLLFLPYHISGVVRGENIVIGRPHCQRIAITAAPLRLVTGRDNNEEKERRYSLRQRMVLVHPTAEHLQPAMSAV